MASLADRINHTRVKGRDDQMTQEANTEYDWFTFERTVAGFIYDGAGAQLIESRVLVLAEHFECASSTIRRWAIGNVRPHPTLAKQALELIARSESK